MQSLLSYDAASESHSLEQFSEALVHTGSRHISGPVIRVGRAALRHALAHHSMLNHARGGVCAGRGTAAGWPGRCRRQFLARPFRHRSRASQLRVLASPRRLTVAPFCCARLQRIDSPLLVSAFEEGNLGRAAQVSFGTYITFVLTGVRRTARHTAAC
jgi:hypothetical protein